MLFVVEVGLEVLGWCGGGPIGELGIGGLGIGELGIGLGGRIAVLAQGQVDPTTLLIPQELMEATHLNTLRGCHLELVERGDRERGQRMEGLLRGGVWRGVERHDPVNGTFKDTGGVNQRRWTRNQ